MELDHEKFMQMAIDVSRRSEAEDGRAHPKVGAVIVLANGEVVTGYRGELAPGDHAEYTALEKKLKDETVSGATV
jgi:pyrimidine deaminase RibD-like protein